MKYFSLLPFICVSFSVLSINPVSSDVGAPYANTESFIFPAGNVCHARVRNSDTAQTYFETTQVDAGRLRVTASSYSPSIDCLVPFQYDRYIRSIVVSASGISATPLRACKVAPVRANSGTAATENMPIVSWNNQEWFRHDDLGIVPFYKPTTNLQYAFLRVSCSTWNGDTSFSHIRVDYDL